jgi:hypothetical protein
MVGLRKERAGQKKVDVQSTSYKILHQGVKEFKANKNAC